MKLQINSYQNFNAQIPLSQYKGPILKLTEEETTLINSMQSEIGRLIIEKTAIKDYCFRFKHMRDSILHDFKTQENIIDTRIKFLREEIRKIKINRITQQRNQVK